MVEKNNSQNAMEEATRSRASFSGHGQALGAAGVREATYDPENCEDLSEPGQSISLTPSEHGFADFHIGAEWDNIQITQEKSFFGRLMKKARRKGVDLDLGCLYEMQDGSRGCLQAFGEKHGNFDMSPFMALSVDERTGDKEGHDELISVNGPKWTEIKRMVIYIYIYDGASRWSVVKPKVIVDVPGENDLIVTLRNHQDELPLCAVGGLENRRGGMVLTNFTEYFPGHEEMDRAFGFGLDWGEGQKS